MPHPPSDDPALTQHLTRGYARARRADRVALGVMIGGGVLLVACAAGFVHSAVQSEFFSPEASGFARAMGSAYASAAVLLTALTGGSVLLCGLALRAAAAARRAALDAAALASGLAPETVRAFVLGT